jgi:RNA 3'-terminal phosphate cyclase (ATP)
MLPLLRRMGIDVAMRMDRPGYVPTGGGILHLAVSPLRRSLKPLVFDEPGAVDRVWGIALSSQLKNQSVSDRMANAARSAFVAAGLKADIHVLYDESARQPGAGLAVFADLNTHARLGSDRAGAPGRRSEAIGKRAARCLLEDLATGATLDRFAGDQIIPFAALASGESRFRIPYLSEHIESNAWLSREFLGAEVRAEGHELVVKGAAFLAR